MTQETIDLIIEWFGHIHQMATDRKTLTGAIMDAQHCLNEIAAVANNSKQFVEEYQYEQEPINEEELDKLAIIEGAKAINHFVNREESKFAFEWADLVKEAYKNGFRKAKEV